MDPIVLEYFKKVSTLISKQMLTTQLRELEKNGIITCEIFPEIPPRVEYTITPLGKTLFRLLKLWILGVDLSNTFFVYIFFVSAIFEQKIYT